MADEQTSGTGQALVNSHTFWGSMLTAIAGSGVLATAVPVIPAILSACGVPVLQAAAATKALGVLAGVGWTLFGRMRAQKPITGVFKAKS